MPGAPRELGGPGVQHASLETRIPWSPANQRVPSTDTYATVVRVMGKTNAKNATGEKTHPRRFSEALRRPH